MSSVEEFIEFLKRLAEKWSRSYEEDGVFEADPMEGAPKYFLTAAYMYPNAPIHVGHGRTYLVADALARFKRLLGYNVLFPMGFHYTGTPVLVRVEAIVENNVKEIEAMSRTFNVDAETLRKLRDPVRFARYFHELSKEVMKGYGLSIDWRREFTTVDPDYKAFIRWQFTKLLRSGLLVRGTHPVGWCPRHGMPVSMHDTEGDVEPEIGELTLIKFVDDRGTVFPAATLRPETVLGVTNMWVNPNARYCVSSVGSERWVVSCEAVEKLRHQLKSVEPLEELGGSELVGREVLNPVTGEKVRVLPAAFVSPRFGTGVVMSVPAHAPYDYAALRDYVEKSAGGAWPRELAPRPLIEVPGWSDVPARDAVERLGVGSQTDVERLEEATAKVYREEFERGVVRPDVVSYVVSRDPRVVEFLKSRVAERPVKEARESVKDLLRDLGALDSMYEVINAPVRCRCGAEVVVKVLENQWFIDYGNEAWKALTREALRGMRIVPEEARRGIEATIEWLKERACARTRGLGTELPWEPGWVIEALSDSTIYMAFYTVVHRIRSLGVRAEDLDERFWDYVFLGIGDPREVAGRIGVRTEDLESIRREFLYWYPLDSRHSGKDLIPNHLTFFVFNHTAVFPRELWPRQIVVNGWVLVEGAKMSKSRGNVRLLRNLMDAYSPDALRLGLILGAEVDQDLDLSEETIIFAARQLARIYSTVEKILASATEEVGRRADEWLRRTLSQHVANYVSEVESVKLRAAALRVYVRMLEDLETYVKWAGTPGRVAREYVAEWVKLMSPFTPFVAEELWRAAGGRGYVAKAVIDRKLVEEGRLPEVEQRYVDLVSEDIRSVLEVVRGEAAVLYVADGELSWLVKSVAEDVVRGADSSETVRRLSRDLARAGLRQPDRVVRALREAVSYMGADRLLRYLEAVGGFDEFEILSRHRELIAVRLGLKDVVVYRASDPEAPDLGGRKGRALPLKPGIYIASSSS